MDYVNLVLFESPFRLGVLSFLLFAVVVLARRRWVGAMSRYSLPATLGVIALLFVIQSLVITQREQVLQAVAVLIEAVETKDTAALQGVVSREYLSEDMDRDDIVSLIRAALQTITIQDTRRARSKVTIDGDRAELILAVRATVSIRGGIGEYHVGRWWLSWLNESDGWKIVALRPELIDNSPVNSMRHLVGYTP